MICGAIVGAWDPTKGERSHRQLTSRESWQAADLAALAPACRVERHGYEFPVDGFDLFDVTIGIDPSFFWGGTRPSRGFPTGTEFDLTTLIRTIPMGARC